MLQKILLIRFSSLGDIILTFPLINKLRKEYPEVKISFLTKNKFSPVLKLHPYIDEIIELDESNISATRKVISTNNYDLILDLHKSFLSYKATRYVTKKVRRIYKDNFKKFLLVKFKWNKFKKIIPVYEKYINAFEQADNHAFTSSPLVFPKERKNPDKYILVSPCAKHYTKTWPAWKFIDYFHTYKDQTFIIIGENNDREMQICGKIASGCKNVINKCGELNYEELANFIYNSEYVICNDSAILHFAEAIGKPVKAIFGSTVEEFGFFPQLEGSQVYEDRRLECRPCTHIGRSECPLGHFKCMDENELIRIQIN